MLARTEVLDLLTDFPDEIEAYGSHVICKQIDTSSTISPGGLVVLHDRQGLDRRAEMATVLACGVGGELPFDWVRLCQIQPGDTVYFEHMRGANLRYENEHYIVLHISEILCSAPISTSTQP